MLTSFSVENYRCFVERTTFELRPLTLLFGYNNAGKSAAMRVLPLLADSCASTTRGVLALESPALRKARFSDLISRLGEAPKVGFGLAWDGASEGEVPGKYRFVMRELPELRRQIMMELEASARGNSYEAVWIPEDENTARWYDVTTSLQSANHLGDGSRSRLLFDGIVPRKFNIRNLGEEFEELLRRQDPEVAFWSQFGSSLRSNLAQVLWLGSIRRPPERSEEFPRWPLVRLEPDGAGADAILAFDKVGTGTLLQEVSRWYEKHFSQRLDVEIVQDRYSVTLGPVKAPGVRINLADTGEGMAQVLPVLVAAAQAREVGPNQRRLLVLEQPELHLHPAAHGALAAYFCELASQEEPPRILLETHSENMLLRVQLEIVRENLHPDSVLVYWIRQLEDGRSVAERITFDALARPQGNWPPGVFSEDLDQARQLILERRKREAI